MQARRRIGVDVVAALATPARAQTYPDHAVRLIIPFPPGGSHRHARPHRGAEALRRLGPIGVHREPPRRRRQYRRRRGGAGRARRLHHRFRRPVHGGECDDRAYRQNFDPVKNFAPVILVATGQDVLMVPPNSPFHSVKDSHRVRQGASGRAHLRLARRRLERPSCDRRCSARSPASRCSTCRMFPSARPSPTLSAGRISLWLTTLGGSLGHIQAGKLRALAVSGPRRAPRSCPTCRPSTSSASPMATTPAGTRCSRRPARRPPSSPRSTPTPTKSSPTPT